MKRCFRDLFALLVIVLAHLAAIFVPLPSVRGQDFLGIQPDQGKQWAILIGVENYRLANPLSYTINDVDQIANTLRERGNASTRNIVKFVDTAEESNRVPSLASLKAELPAWFQKPGPKDRILVYFSGHGFRSADGKLYLAPVDCDPKNPEATGLSVAWLRDQIAGCRAGLKLLVLDACHAGTEKGDDDNGIVSKDLGESFKDLEGVVTLASSTGSEKSQIWSEKKQSLFSYWLNQGLKGHADDNGDSVVDIDEINKYVYDNVTETAKSRFHRQQTPVRIIRTGLKGHPSVIELAPLQLKHLISDMADQVIWSMDSRQIKKVGVMQFTVDTELGEALGGQFGALGRWCAAELENKLLKAGTFEVMDSRELVTTLKRQGFTVDQLGSREALAKLSADLDGLPAIVTGTLRHRQNRMITLQTKLKQIENNTLAAAAGGTALLNENEWAMLGYSVAVQPEDRPLPLPGSNSQNKFIENLDQKAKGAHPLKDPKFPYRVAIMINGKERVGKFEGNDYIVPIKTGEAFSVYVTMLKQEPVFMRLLVDGLNVLPMKVAEKGLNTMEVAPIVPLEKARGFVLDPVYDHRKLYNVDGFYTETGVVGELRQFIMVEDKLSVAAQKNFTENLGIITAAFYAPVGPRSAGMGQAKKVNAKERAGIAAGDLVGVVNIRYVDPGSAK